MRNTHLSLLSKPVAFSTWLQGNVPVYSSKCDPLRTVPSTVVPWASGGQQPILVVRDPGLKGKGRDKELGSMSQFSTSPRSGF